LYRPHCKPLEDRCLLSVTLSGSEPSVPLVGSPVIWTAAASGDGTTPVYQFSVGPAGGPSHVVRDFSSSNNFTWNPMQQGSYDIQVTVKDSFSAATGESATAS
jgi:N-acetylmuramoyl-L-alanine amidase